MHLAIGIRGAGGQGSLMRDSVGKQADVSFEKLLFMSLARIARPSRPISLISNTRDLNPTS
jgi:hypothetical protein